MLLRLPFLDAPLIDHHAFRQTQTAITACWFACEGITLPAYPLPVLGHPWTAPFEFPLFQMIVAGIQRFSVQPDLAARASGLLFYVLSVAAGCRLLGQLGLHRLVLWSFLVFAALAPFGIVWGRASLIEFLAVFLALAYLSSALRWALAPSGAAMPAIAIVAGVAAAAVKPTTLAVYWTAVAALACWQLTTALRTKKRPPALTWVWLAMLLAPFIAAYLWTDVADDIKRASPFSAFLSTDSSRSWNYGSLAQRGDPSTWWIIAGRVCMLVFGGWFMLPALGMTALRGPWNATKAVLAGLLLGSMSAVLIFFNLYLVHDYYLCAIVVPLWLFAALGVTWIEKRRTFRWPGGLRLAIGAVLFVTSFTSPYVWSSYLPLDSKGVLPAAAVIAENTGPDDELIVFGDDWDPTLAYYAQRRVLMAARDNGSAESAARLRGYARARAVRFIVTRDSADRAREVFPEARLVAGTGAYRLFRLD